MREILTISTPAGISASIKQIAKKKGFKSVSDYVLYSIRQEQSMISEEEILESTAIAKDNYKNKNIYNGLDTLKNMLG